MSRDAVNSFCATLPAAERSEPFGPGHDVWKVSDKIFAAIGAQTPGVSVKCESVAQADHLRDLFGWVRAPYFHASWVLVPFGTDVDELHHRIDNSYRVVRASLTKKAQAALPAYDQA